MAATVCSSDFLNMYTLTFVLKMHRCKTAENYIPKRWWASSHASS